MDNVDYTFSQRLREARERQGLTAAELSRQSDVAVQSLSCYESTSPKNHKQPKIESAVKLAKALGVSVDWLCGVDEELNSKQFTSYKDIVKCLLTLGECFYRARIYAPKDKAHVEIAFFDGTLARFFQEYNKMVSLLNDETITDEIFETWLNGRMELLSECEIPTNPLIDENENSSADE